MVNVVPKGGTGLGGSTFTKKLLCFIGSEGSKT